MRKRTKEEAKYALEWEFAIKKKLNPITYPFSNRQEHKELNFQYHV